MSKPTGSVHSGDKGRLQLAMPLEASSHETTPPPSAEDISPSPTTYPLTSHLENLKSKGFTYPATVVLGSTLLILTASTYSGYRIGRRSTHQALQSANAATYRLALRQSRNLRNVPAGITSLQNDVAALRSEHESLAWSLSATPVSDVLYEVTTLGKRLEGLEKAVAGKVEDNSRINQSLAALQQSVNDLLEQRIVDQSSITAARDESIQAKEEAESLRNESKEWRSEVLDALQSLQDNVSGSAATSSNSQLTAAEHMNTANRDQGDAVADHWAASFSAEELDEAHQDAESLDDAISGEHNNDALSLDSPLHASFGYRPQHDVTGDASSTAEAPKRGRPRGSKRRNKLSEAESEVDHQPLPPADQHAAQDTTHPYDPSYEARMMSMRYRSLTMSSLPRRLYPYQ